MNKPKTLIFIPTYNEKDNVEKLISEINNLNLENTDVLFIDDNSPDGTGQLLDSLAIRNKRLFIKHRSGKLGIGSAHFDGIMWAYENRYDRIITMDCDFTHNPSYIPKLISASENYDVVTTSRFISKDSLAEWNLFRKAMTNLGHILTRCFIQLKFDATGAFRLYKLNVIPSLLFQKVESKGYSFLFESLFVLNINQISITEIPVDLPARTYGSSKMQLKDILKSVVLLFKLSFYNVFARSKYMIN